MIPLQDRKKDRDLLRRRAVGPMFARVYNTLQDPMYAPRTPSPTENTSLPPSHPHLLPYLLCLLIFYFSHFHLNLSQLLPHLFNDLLPCLSHHFLHLSHHFLYLSHLLLHIFTFPTFSSPFPCCLTFFFISLTCFSFIL